MDRPNRAEWRHLHRLTLLLHRAGDVNEMLETLRHKLPDLLGVPCRLSCDPDPDPDPDLGEPAGSQDGRPLAEGRLGPFRLEATAPLPPGSEEILEALVPHLELAWQRAAPSEELLRRHPAYGELTRRQREVLPLLLRGLSNSEIGHELCISPRTAEKHVAALARVLGVRRGNGAVQTGGRSHCGGEESVNT